LHSNAILSAAWEKRVTLSVLSLFRLGIGPFIPHAVGPVLIAKRFVEIFERHWDIAGLSSVLFKPHGSLAAGHATQRAVVLGLMG
jgi:L-serine dehydratase